MSHGEKVGVRGRGPWENFHHLHSEKGDFMNKFNYSKISDEGGQNDCHTFAGHNCSTSSSLP